MEVIWYNELMKYIISFFIGALLVLAVLAFIVVYIIKLIAKEFKKVDPNTAIYTAYTIAAATEMIHPDDPGNVIIKPKKQLNSGNNNEEEYTEDDEENEEYQDDEEEDDVWDTDDTPDDDDW